MKYLTECKKVITDEGYGLKVTTLYTAKTLGEIEKLIKKLKLDPHCFHVGTIDLSRIESEGE